MAPRSSDHVTLLIFKDQHVARSIELPLGWLTRFSFLIAGLAAAVMVLGLLAFREFRVARRYDPSRIVDLEQEVRELRDYRSKAGGTTQTTSQASQTPAAVVPTPPPTPAITTSSTPVNTALLGALPQGATLPSPEAQQAASIRIQNPKATWAGNQLRVRFALEYLKQDQGTQTGRIVLIARGSETLVGYPDGVFGKPADAALLLPEKGEYFSVSKFRDAKIDLPPVRNRALKQVEILIFSTEGQILLHQTVPVADTAPKSPPKTKLPDTSPNAPATPGASLMADPAQGTPNTPEASP